MTQFSAEPSPQSRPSRTPWYAILAVLSIGFNLLILIGLLTIRGMIGGTLASANQNLFETINTLNNYEGYTVNVRLNEEVRLDQSEPVLFEDTISVPIKTNVTVNEVIPFNDQIVVPINTTVPVNKVVQAPLDIAGSRVFIPVPIDLTVPIDMQVTVPIEAEVPVTLDVPIDFEVDVAMSELIPLTNRNGDPLTITLDVDTEVEVPLAEILREVNLTPTLGEIHRALNVVESILLLPAPESASTTPPTAQR